MGTLSDRIRADLTSAMKARDSARTSTLRMLQAAVKNEEIEKRRELSDDEVMAVVSRSVKQRHEAAEQYRRGGREELAAKEESEVLLLRDYLPQQLSDADTEKIVQDVVQMTGTSSRKDAGKVMKEIMGKYRGQVDGKKVQEILNRVLGD
jgi:uncharacterized protein